MIQSNTDAKYSSVSKAVKDMVDNETQLSTSDKKTTRCYKITQTFKALQDFMESHIGGPIE